MPSSAQFSSVTQLCPTLFNLMDCSTPDLLVHHQLPEFTQTHAHQVGDAIQPSHPLLSPSLPAFNGRQRKCFSDHHVDDSAQAKVLRQGPRGPWVPPHTVSGLLLCVEQGKQSPFKIHENDTGGAWRPPGPPDQPLQTSANIFPKTALPSL